MQETASDNAMGLKENLIRTLRYDRPDHVPYWGEGVMIHLFHGIVNRSTETGLDSWGVGWELKEEKLGSFASESAIKSVDDIKHYRPPDPIADGLFDQAIEQLDSIDKEKNLVIGYNAFVKPRDCFACSQ